MGNAEILMAHMAGGWTPLIYAAYRGNVQEVKSFITAKTIEEETALMWAGKKGHKEIVKILIAAKAKFLIAAKADVNLKNMYCETTLFYTVYHQYERETKLLIAEIDVNAKNVYGRTALFSAIRPLTAESGKSIEMIKLLVTANTDVKC